MEKLRITPKIRSQAQEAGLTSDEDIVKAQAALATLNTIIQEEAVHTLNALEKLGMSNSYAVRTIQEQVDATSKLMKGTNLDLIKMLEILKKILPDGR